MSKTCPIYKEDAVNKTELIESVSDNAGLTKREAETAVDAVLYAVTSSVKAGDPVRLVGFGTFELRERKARKGRNPQSGATVQIKASKSMAFRAGSKLKTDLMARGGLARPKSIAVPARLASGRPGAATAPATRTAAPSRSRSAAKPVATRAVSSGPRSAAARPTPARPVRATTAPRGAAATTARASRIQPEPVKKSAPKAAGKKAVAKKETKRR
jgi:nucleoid DNA-binding protein